MSVDAVTAAERQILAEHQLREKVINEEFKIWKKTVPLLYDTIHTRALEYALLSVDFLKDAKVSENKNFVTVQMVLGTNSFSGSDSVKLASLDLPSTLSPDFAKFVVGDSIPIPVEGNSGSFRIDRSWPHPGEVNKLRVSPDGSRIATFDNKGVVHVFDINSESTSGLELKAHAAEGYALEWVSSTELLSGANDGQIFLWDVTKPEAPVKLFTSHSAVVSDISFCPAAKNLFGSVSDDGTTQIHDLRSPELSPVIKISTTHIQNAIAWHPSLPQLLATAGKDNVVNLYDLRNPKTPIRQLFRHNDSVVGLKWDPGHEPSHLYSWALDKRVITWDINNLKEEFLYPTAEVDTRRKYKHTDDPCFKFVHGGHTNRVNDLAVHPTIPNVFATVGDDTLIEVYKPKTISEEDQEDEEEEELDREDDKKEENEENGEKEEKEEKDDDMDEDHEQKDEQQEHQDEEHLDEQPKEEHANGDVDMAEA